VNFFGGEIGRVRDQNAQNNFDWAVVDLMFRNHSAISRDHVSESKPRTR